MRCLLGKSRLRRLRLSPIRLFMRWMAVSLACLATVACTTVPETGRRQLVLFGSEQEMAIGERAFAEIKRQKKISRNAAANAQVQRVGRRLASVVDAPGTRWEFAVFEDPEPNAFALPGGKIGVNTGLLPITRNDTGLAVIIGHEIAHVMARHGSERASQGLLAQLGGALLDLGLTLGTDLPASTRGLINMGYGVGAQVGVLLPYSRLQESEADRLGLIYMARAGYDPREAVAVWERFADYNRRLGRSTPIALLSTHPVDSQRLATIQKHMPEALEEYHRAKTRKARAN